MVEQIGHVWFNARGCVGIVMGYDDITKKAKAWIAASSGVDEEQDIKQIMDWGAKFPVEEAYTLILKFGSVTDLEIWKKLTSFEQEIENSTT